MLAETKPHHNLRDNAIMTCARFIRAADGVHEMGRDNSYTKAILLFLVGVVILFSIGYYVNKGVCDAKTSDIGFPHRFSVMGNCQIEITPGQWIPLDSYYFQQP